MAAASRSRSYPRSWARQAASKPYRVPPHGEEHLPSARVSRGPPASRSTAGVYPARTANPAGTTSPPLARATTVGDATPDPGRDRPDAAPTPAPTHSVSSTTSDTVSPARTRPPSIAVSVRPDSCRHFRRRRGR